MCKRQKGGTVDRISPLPNCILHHILSFLNTKYVVQTSLLSKRWRSVWESIPYLNFDFDSFHPPAPYYSTKMIKPFKNFILHVLSRRRGEHIQKFKYCLPFYEETNFVKMLICYAICHNVQELCIDASFLESLEWPRCLFTCTSLNAIKLSGHNVMDLIPSGLSALKSLYLESTVKCPDLFRVEIISGCPNLESLVLVNFLFQHINITAAKLSNLEIHYGRFVDDSKIIISAPRLTSVAFKGLVPVINSVEDFSYLEKVAVDIKSYSSDDDESYQDESYDDEDERNIALNLISMLSIFRNAKFFNLSMKTMEFLSMFPDLLEGQPSLFCNLRHLKLKAEKNSTMISMPINVMTHLLKNSACVETIVVELPKDKSEQVR